MALGERVRALRASPRHDAQEARRSRRRVGTPSCQSGDGSGQRFGDAAARARASPRDARSPSSWARNPRRAGMDAHPGDAARARRGVAATGAQGARRAAGQRYGRRRTRRAASRSSACAAPASPRLGACWPRTCACRSSSSTGVVERMAGCDVGEIHALYGAAAYRRYELRALEETIAAHRARGDRDGRRARLRTRDVRSAACTLLHRVAARDARRPHEARHRPGRPAADGGRTPRQWKI